MHRDFAITTKAWGTETMVVSVLGEVDVVTAPDFAAELLRAVELGATVVVDLTETTFLDSSAIHALLGGSERSQASGGQVCVVCSNPSLKKVLEITRVDRVLDVYATLEQATSARRSAASPKPSGLLTRLSAFVFREKQEFVYVRSGADVDVAKQPRRA